MSETVNKTAIFWDYENVPFSSGDLTNFLNDIEELKKNLGEGSFLRCFGDWKRIPETTQTEIRLRNSMNSQNLKSHFFFKNNYTLNNYLFNTSNFYRKYEDR